MSLTKSPPVLTKQFIHHPLSNDRKLKVFGYWLGSLSPAVLVVASALLVFRDSVVSSIASTPHPELVYAILGTFLLGVVLTSLTLYRYTMEGNLIHHWSNIRAPQRERLLISLEWKSYLLPLFEILQGERHLSAGSRQAVIEQEIVAVNDRFNDRLSLPNYLAGALVGLGLVGTFVGLLGTLEDLGKLFGALVQTGSANTNPVDIFSDMVRRLQDPMRGMGTAFVASLYGLLGSLILGLQILAVGKIGRGLIHQLHVLVRRSEMVSPDVIQQSVSGNHETVNSLGKQIQAWDELHGLLRLQHQQQQKENDSLRREVLHVTQNNQVITEKILDQVSNASRSTLDEQTKRWQEMVSTFRAQLEQSHSETQLLRSEIFKVTQICQSLAIAVRESLSAEERFREAVPRTSYWQEAWVKVQDYLQRSNSDQTLNELSRISKQNIERLNDISATLEAIRGNRVRN